MGISNIGKFIKDLGACDVYELVSSAARKSIKTSAGRTRITLQSKDLEELGLQYGLGTIKHPKLVIGGNNTKKGQSVWNATVCDNAGKPVESWTIGYDTTRGKSPVFQFRRVTFDGDKKIFAESEFIDSNKMVSENPMIKSSVYKENGMTIISADAEGAYKLEQRAAGTKKISELENRTGISTLSPEVIINDLKLLQRENTIKERLDFIRETFKVKTPYAQRRLEKIGKMDLKGLEKEIQIQQARLRRQEQELEQIYAKVFGKGESAPDWRKEFIDRNITKINPITKKAIPARTIKRIKHKMSDYNNTRAIIIAAMGKKHIASRFGELDSQYISKMLSELKIKALGNTDLIMVKELQALRGLPKTELIEKAKNIICKRTGLPEDLIKIEPLEKGGGLKEYCACFEETKVRLYYHPTLLEIPDDIIIGLVRHELDHFEVIAKMVKKTGLEEFKAMIHSRSEEALKMFDNEQWEKVLKRITVEESFNSELYKKAYQEYALPWGSFSNLIKYLSNPMELRAYQAGFNIETALNGGNTATLTATQLIKCTIGKEIQLLFGELEQILGKGFMISQYAQKLKTRAVNSIADITSSNFETDVLNQALKIVRQDLVRAKSGTFNDPSYIKAVREITSACDKKVKIKTKSFNKIRKSIFNNLKDVKDVTPLVKKQIKEKMAG